MGCGEEGVTHILKMKSKTKIKGGWETPVFDIGGWGSRG